MGIFSRVFGRASAGNAEPAMTVRTAIEIINAYGRTLEVNAPDAGCVADVSKLPHSKERLSEALIWGLTSKAHTHMKDVLKVGCLELSSWQPGVGPNDIGMSAASLAASFASQGDIEAHARRIVAQAPLFAKWQRLVDDERTTREKGLKAKGLW